MTDRQKSRASTHADGCWSWGPGHYECAVREINALRARGQRDEALLRQAMVGTTESELLRSVIADAYSQPRWSVPENRQNAIHEFRDKWYLRCYEQFVREQ